MKYTQKSFSVGGASKTYSDNWERTFRSEQKPARCPAMFGDMQCRLLKDHADLHVYSTQRADVT